MAVLSRRRFLRRGYRWGLAAATVPWFGGFRLRPFGLTFVREAAGESRASGGVGTMADQEDAAVRAVETCRRLGAEWAEAYVESRRSAVLALQDSEVVRDVESRHGVLCLRVSLDGQVGFAHGTDMTGVGLTTLSRRAVADARQSMPDEFAGLSSDELTACPDLELFDPRVADIDRGTRLERCRSMMGAARTADDRVIGVEEASLLCGASLVTIANSRGFLSSYRGTNCQAATIAIARGASGVMTGHAVSQARHLADLTAPSVTGATAGQRAVARLDARRPDVSRCPLVIAASAAPVIWKSVFDALDGRRMVDGTSFLRGELGESVAASCVTLIDDGRVPRGIGSAPFDGEGVSTRSKRVIDGGSLRMYFYDVRTARRAGTKATGNAMRASTGRPGIGPTNLYVPAASQEETPLDIRDGFVVTDLTGPGLDPISGRFLWGAVGTWVRGGEAVHAADGVVLRGDLSEFLMRIVAVGGDLEFQGRVGSPGFRIAEWDISPS